MRGRLIQSFVNGIVLKKENSTTLGHKQRRYGRRIEVPERQKRLIETLQREGIQKRLDP
ncbi:hypothetical protein D3C72_1884960 [compost metagenome]